MTPDALHHFAQSHVMPHSEHTPFEEHPRKGGRPPLPTGAAANVPIRVYTTLAQAAELDKLARQRGLSRSAYLVAAGLTAGGQSILPQPLPSEEWRRYWTAMAPVLSLLNQAERSLQTAIAAGVAPAHVDVEALANLVPRVYQAVVHLRALMLPGR